MYRLIRRALLTALSLTVALHAQSTLHTAIYDMDGSSNATNTGHILRRCILNSDMLFMVKDNAGIQRMRKTTGSSVNVINDQVRAYVPVTVYGKAYFPGDDGVNGLQPWVTDGSAMTMLMVVPLPSNAYLSSLYPMPGAGGTTYLAVDATTTPSGKNHIGVRGSESYLYRTNGTPSGTTLLKQWSSGDPAGGVGALLPLNSQTSIFQVWNGYTVGKGGIWKTNGTSKGTVAVKLMFAYGECIIVTVGGTPYYYFVGDDGSTGRELWRTDGTSAGTICVANLNPGAASSSPAFVTLCGGKLYFSATTPSTGTELFCHDPATGQTGQTGLVWDIQNGIASSSPFYLTDKGGLLYFSATTETNGRELYEYNPALPTSSSNPRLIEICPNAGSGNPKYAPGSGMPDHDNPGFTIFGSYLYFPATDGNGYKLWRSNGSTTEVVEGYDLTGATNPNSPVALGSTLFYVAYTATNGYELWKYTPGTVPKRVTEADAPVNLALEQNHPNPFASATTLTFSLAAAGPVRLAVFDMLGREVAVLRDGMTPSGTHEAVFHAGMLPSGCYLVRLTTGEEVRTRVIRLLR